TVVRSIGAGALRDGSPVTYDVHDLVRVNGWLFGGAVSYAAPFARRWQLRTRLGAGLLAAQSTDVLTGTASASSGTAPLGVAGVGSTLTSLPFFLMPEAGVEVPIGAVRIGAMVSAFFVLASSPTDARGPATVPATCTAQAPAQIGCARDSAALENERTF